MILLAMALIAFIIINAGISRGNRALVPSLSESPRERHREEIARYEREMAARAEWENRLWHEGDSKGLYGLSRRWPERPPYTVAERAARRWERRTKPERKW